MLWMAFIVMAHYVARWLHTIGSPFLTKKKKKNTLAEVLQLMKRLRLLSWWNKISPTDSESFPIAGFYHPPLCFFPPFFVGVALKNHRYILQMVENLDSLPPCHSCQPGCLTAGIELILLQHQLDSSFYCSSVPCTSGASSHCQEQKGFICLIECSPRPPKKEMQS